MLSAQTDCMGYYRAHRKELAVCAWQERLWEEAASQLWMDLSGDTLERLGVVVRKRGPRLVIEWSEDQARAFQLLDVFMHELGHHADRLTTCSRRRTARGEPYAHRFARGMADLVWDDYLRVFPI